MQQEYNADQCYDHALFEQRVLERIDRRVDQIGAIVDRNDLDRFRQAAGNLPESLLDVFDDVEGVGTEALQHDAAGNLSLAVQFSDAAPLVRAKLDAGHIAQQNRGTVAGLEHDVAEIVDALQISLASDDILEFGKLDGTTADIGIAGTDRVAHLLHGDAEIAHALRVENDVVLLDEAADARHLRDAFGLGQRKLQIPVLDGAGVGKIELLRHHRILVDPADAGGIGTDRRRHTGGQSRGRAVEEFEHARARPVDVGAVLEDDIDKGNPEEREPAHDLGTRHRQHCGGQRIGDLVLDHLRGLTGVFRIDDHLRVGEVRNGVEWQMDDCINAGSGGKPGAEQHQQQVAGRPGDQTRDHGRPPASENPLSAAFRLLSASIRKVAATTTGSPSAIPSLTST